MEFTITQDFPCTLARLWTVFGQRRYPRQKYLALGATGVRLQRFNATGACIEVALERDVVPDARALPPWARPWVKPCQTLRHTSLWRRITPARAEAELDIQPLGLPVRAHASGALDPLPGGGTRMTLRWRVRSPVPVLGHRLEQLFAGQLRAALEEDHRFTLGYLRQAANAGRGARRSPAP
jgi:hypothetical protein